MNNQKTEDLSRRVGELESLAWALFRALETYITLNDLMKALDEEDKP